MHAKLIALIFSLLIFFCGELGAKVRILTFHFNKPDFIELQDRTLQKFLKNEYELIVFNDAADPRYEEEIRAVCERLNIRCIRYEPRWHRADPLNVQILQWLNDLNTVHSHVGFLKDLEYIANQPSVRHCHVIQYALDHFGYDHDDLVLILDGDCFPIRPVDLKALMADCQIFGSYKYLSEEDVGYFIAPFTALNMPALPNKSDLRFNVDLIGKYVHDTGAHLYHYLKNNPQISVRKYAWHGSSVHHFQSRLEMVLQGFNDWEVELTKNLPWPLGVEFHIDHQFLHFGASSFCVDGHDVKEQHVKAFLNKILEIEN